MRKAVLRRRIKNLERHVAVLELLLRRNQKKSAPIPGRVSRFFCNLKSIITGRGGLQ